MQPITICHFHTGIGNFVQMTPALQALASMDKSGKIDLCTDAIWTDYRKSAVLSLWERLPFVNKILSVKELDLNQYKTWFWTYWTTHGEAKELFDRKKHYEIPEWDKNKEHESDY